MEKIPSLNFYKINVFDNFVKSIKQIFIYFIHTVSLLGLISFDDRLAQSFRELLL